MTINPELSRQLGIAMQFPPLSRWWPQERFRLVQAAANASHLEDLPAQYLPSVRAALAAAKGHPQQGMKIGLKHLSGRHNQSTHGRGWNSGRGRERDGRGRFARTGSPSSSSSSSAPSSAPQRKIPSKLKEALGDRARLEEAVRTVAEGARLPSGLKVGTVDANGVGTWHFDIRDEKGDVVAEFSRTAYEAKGKLVVKHDTAKVEEAWQRQGIATAINNEFEYWYSDSGVDHIFLVASGGGSTNGGYTWARAGYDWHSAMSGEHLKNLLRDMRREADREGDEALVQELDVMYTQVQKSPWLTTNWPTPAEIAALGYKPGATTWPGREVMRQESWPGQKRPKRRPQEAA